MALLLALLLALGAALGAPVEVRLWHSYRGAERTALEQLLARYEAEHPGVRVDALALPYDGFVTKLEAAIPRGNGPDVFVFAHERAATWRRAGLVAPVGPAPQRLHPLTVEAFTVDGELLGVPLAFKCLALFYNRALVPEPPRTTDELFALARRLAGSRPRRYALAYQATEPFFHAPWMHAFGGGVFLGGRVVLDRPENAASLAFARRLLDEGVVPDETTGTLVTNLFNRGLAATAINGPWFIGEIDEGIDYGVAPLPVVSETGRPAAPYLTVEGVLLSARAAHPEEALALARWLASPEAARVRALRGRQSVATVLDAPEVAADPVLAAFRAQLEHSVPTPSRPEMASTWEPMARALRKVMRGALEPGPAVRAAQQEFLVVTAPPPPPADPRPWIAAAVLAALAGAGALGRAAWRARAEVRRHALAYAYVAPAALAMLVLVVLPFLVGAAVSLFAHRGGEWTFVGLANFLNIVLARDWPPTSPLSFYFTLAVTVLWTVANVALHVVFGVALALLLREPWLRLRGVYRVLLVLPWAVPNYITALVWKGMFHRQFGAVNGLLVALGLEPVSWFSRFSTAFAANLATNTWLGFPFMMVVTLGALQAIPRELEQAAEVDGATRWQRLRHVTLPLLKPALLPAVVLGSVWTFNMFNVIYLVSGGEPDGATEILISEAYRWAFSRQARYGYAAAYAVLIFGVLLLYSRAANRLAGRRVL